MFCMKVNGYVVVNGNTRAFSYHYITFLGENVTTDQPWLITLTRNYVSYLTFEIEPKIINYQLTGQFLVVENSDLLSEIPIIHYTKIYCDFDAISQIINRLMERQKTFVSRLVWFAPALRHSKSK